MANEIEIFDTMGRLLARVVQADGKSVKPLSCGATCWVEVFEPAFCQLRIGEDIESA